MAALVYLAICASVALWFAVTGQVIAPYLQEAELGLPATQTSSIQNQKFSDFYQNYVAELQQHIASPRSGWIATWSDMNELGRPLYQTEGLSPAYVPTWLLMQLSHDPVVIITTLVLLTAFLGGFFALLLAREWELHPLAALSAALLLISTPMITYWATFPMYFAAYCWATGMMWSFQRMTRCRDAGGWLVLAFSAYALLMTVYPQMTVQNSYLLGSWAGVVLWRSLRHQGGRRAATLAAYGASAVLVGTLLALPVFLDLWLAAKESARLNVSPDFYTALFPKIHSWQDAAQWFVSVSAPDLFGNPSAPDYPFVYNGRSAVPWVWLLAIATITLCLRKVWGWWLAVAICIVLVLSEPLYHFGVAHLGFGLSRSNPLAVAVLPMLWLAVYALDSVLRSKVSSATNAKASQTGAVSARLTAFATCLAIVGCAFALAKTSGHAVDDIRVFLIGLSFLAFAGLWSGYVAVAASVGVILAVGAYGWPLLLIHNAASIRWTSPLVEAVRANLPEGSRYAWVTEPPMSLWPNVNATLGLATIHTYNSLSPKSYQALVRELGGEVLVYGRINTWINPPATSASLQLANIALFLSARPLPNKYGTPLAAVGSVFIYRNDQRMGAWMNMPLSEATGDPSSGYRIEQPAQATRWVVERVRNDGDAQEFAMTVTQPSLFVLSQKFHSQWIAEWRDGSEWHNASTVSVNGFFQGVIVPQGTQSVRISFRPWVRYAWCAHLFFAVAGIFIMLNFAWKSRSRRRN